MIWESKNPLAISMLPLSWIFQGLCHIRYAWYRYLKGQVHFPVPIVVVGNISLGGTGKTPFVNWLLPLLQSEGWTPGVVMRGYKGALSKKEIRSVTIHDDPACVGDESLLLARKTNCPVVVGRYRTEAVRYLLNHFPKVNIVILDDGLQHYALARDIEIALIKESKGLGNGYCLPAGPLRESPSRLKKVDFVVFNGKLKQEGWNMETDLQNQLYQVGNPNHTKSITDFAGQTVHAVAGIGHPQTFFEMLKENGIHVIAHQFPDHHAFRIQDLPVEKNLPILMTEKDAVKCEKMSLVNAWAVPMKVTLPHSFQIALLRKIKNG